MTQQTQKLLRLKEQIEAAKIRKAEAEGAVKQERQRLAEDHDCKTVKAAEAKLEKMDEQIEKLNQQIADGLSKLEEDYDV